MIILLINHKIEMEFQKQGKSNNQATNQAR